MTAEERQRWVEVIRARERARRAPDAPTPTTQHPTPTTPNPAPPRG